MDKLYKLILKDNTVINLRGINEYEKSIVLELDTQLTYDEVVGKFTKENLSFVRIKHEDIALSTYVNLKDVEELSIKNQIITIVICKADTKELIINLRNENEQLKTEIENSNSCINELRDMVIAISMQ